MYNQLIGRCCLVFILLFPFGGHAQENQPVKLSDAKYPKKVISQINLLTGPNLIYPKKQYLEDRAIKIGLVINVELNHEINKWLEVSIRGGYENKGLKSRSTQTNPDFPPPSKQEIIKDNTLNYLTFYLLPKVKLTRTRKFYAGLGPYFGYLISKRQKEEIFINDNLFLKRGSRPDPYVSNKKYDFGLTTAVGCRFNLFNRASGIEFQYNLGFYNTSQPTILEFRNQTAAFLLSIPLTK